MTRKILIVLLMMFSLLPVSLLAKDIDLSHYDKPHNVSDLLKDTSIVASLKQLLAGNYEVFVGNFDVFGEVRKIANNGLLIEGWLQDLKLENASALVIYPDERLYAAWVVPESSVVNYKTNAPEKDKIQSDIAQWASQFKHMKISVVKDMGDNAEVDYFNTEKFSITLVTFCEENGDCNNATYLGKRKKDGAELSLKGKAVRADCKGEICPIIAFKFMNGKTHYMLSKIDDSLTVINNNKIILNETGVWSKKE